MQRDGAEVIWGAGARLFWNKNEVGLVNTFEISMAGKEIRHERHNVWHREIPKGFVERRPKTVRSWTGVVVHTKHHKLKFKGFKREN